MKRNVISVIKFIILSIFTIFITIVIFRFLRSSKTSAPSSSQFLQIEEPIIKEVRVNNNEVHDEEKIDWHDLEKIQQESKRKGTGEHGIAASLSPSKDNLKEKLYSVNGFNGALSDEISLNRSIPDIRHPQCRKKKYLKTLDSASIIISFHNEHFSTLMRTCWSVINRSPPSLLEEIILVDDASTKVELKSKLDDYVGKNLSKVKIIRLKKRSGLIRGRLAGAKLAKGKILVFLDSHTEANVNWLPPLLEPITKNYKICVCPFIDVIDFETFQYRAQDEGARGAFDWQLFYKRLPLLPENLKKPSEPFKSPVMAGGLFAISAYFFWELGGYDPGLEIWGGEQYELSFKIWQCGGEMYDAPCSRVGHIYRKFSPFPNSAKGDFLGRNHKRVAEVWMDEYAEFIYKRLPHLRTMDPGDLTERKALREKLHCRSFKWFMEKVAFDLEDVYPAIEPEDFASGEIRNIELSNYCLDAKKRSRDEEVVLDLCSKDNTNKIIGGEQKFRLTWHKDIRPEGRDLCLDVSLGDIESPVTLYPCHGGQGNQLWRYNLKTKWLVHGSSNSRCLDADPERKKVFVTKCDSSSATQTWKIEKVNIKSMNNWENIGPKKT
ncbi:N-acetylgalactosaminyltransferase 6 [Leptopilina heterotoma]|uniref:N-acetylgalactosaminyltransferase 6 n=1 Tax=Leptopilina heterotoma TaxID=63436 RepID=UPI001CAA3EED|nr:N-acetylgalactosaminyltransferase 6 [Leptopilina heterotoma]